MNLKWPSIEEVAHFVHTLCMQNHRPHCDVICNSRSHAKALQAMLGEVVLRQPVSVTLHYPRHPPTLRADSCTDPSEFVYESIMIAVRNTIRSPQDITP